MRTAVMFFCAGLATTASAQITLNAAGPSPLAQFIEPLNRTIDTNGPILLTVKPCGGIENAWWDNASSITYCQEIIQNIARKRQAALTAGRISQDAIDRTSNGEVLFVALHELGHAVIDRHKIPFSGREEDTADQFAAWLIMRLNNPQMYLGATNFFAEPSRMLRVFGKERLTEEHSLNIQRRAQLVCWGYGRDPAGMRVFADDIGLSEDRRQRCAEEYRQLMQNTPRLFAAALKSHSSGGVSADTGYAPPAPRPGASYSGGPALPELPPIPELPALPQPPGYRSSF
ncbi:DUF4344 domain-containing metallopeptidase [Azoarcus sp. KH32C]|uniref:DUF4344 domain-containing metallopeptidase n=1 Tax=Azoarcus sp. KH32C TaxID=748247 RepID=UPI00023865D7|nr:DUF4344 domain-containing metallopeptidase [Azoarcus sp. KH32C]BAL23657.1 hypothetical protein AZKH_1335 [Azoarcus sp. KH32C]